MGLQTFMGFFQKNWQMKEYIINNNLENGDEILNEYQSAYEKFCEMNEQMKYGIITPLKGYIEESDIFRFCLIHDKKLFTLRYYSKEAINDGMLQFQQLIDLVQNGSNHNVLVGNMGFYPCSGAPPKSAISSSKYLWDEWRYCNKCVSESELIDDIKIYSWDTNIIIKYGYRWIPK